MNGPLRILAPLAVLLAAGVALIAVELARGGATYGGLQTKDACTATVEFPGEGFDATVQRIALSGLYGAACELGTSREELVLSFVPAASTTSIPWSRATIERAIRSGLRRAIDDAERRGDIGPIAGYLLRQLVERAPLGWLLDRAAGPGAPAG